MTAYSKHYHVAWAHLDANGHMANSAYLDLVADVRMRYFAEHGFPSSEFVKHRMGPVIQRETLEYRKELRLLDPIEVNYAVEGLSEDGARWIIVNEFIRADGKLAAKVTSTGGWLDLAARALAVPPVAMAAILRAAPRTPSFVQIPGLSPAKIP
jgi:acyl-CoA thioester hydrolase